MNDKVGKQSTSFPNNFVKERNKKNEDNNGETKII